MIDKYIKMMYNLVVRQGVSKLLLWKEVRKMEEMTCKEIARLIEWLKSKGHTSEEIIACIEHISK